MRYRKIGKLPIKASALGFGMMRLPKKFDEKLGKEVADEEEAIKNMRWAIDHGVTYIDTAYMYMDNLSEGIVGKGLKDGYREKVVVATKSPLSKYENEGSFEKILEEQLRRLDIDCIDLYLLHAVNAEFYRERVLGYGIFDKMRKAKADGKIKYMGFSFHDDLDTFKEVVDAFEWDFCQIQLNYFDTDYQAGLEGLKYAADRGLGVIIMEPLRGGFLANLPENIEKIFKDAGLNPIQAALDFLWDRPEVSVVLSGMSTLEQVKDNVKYAGESSVGKLGEKEKEVLKQARRALIEMDTVPCTACNYCNICPQRIAIPKVFEAANIYYSQKNLAKAKDAYKAVSEFGENGSACIGCQACEGVCPQHIGISALMPKLDELLG